MKFAHVATRWIGEGESGDKYRADIPEGYTRMVVLGDQYVNPEEDCPSPNIVVVRIQESRKEHAGYIDSLKNNLNQIVIEVWEEGFPVVPVASAVKLKNFLVRQDMDMYKAAVVADAIDRVSALLEELDDADKRARRRLEVDKL